MIEQITDIKYANKCDELLTKLILDEKQYDDTIDENFKVTDYFVNVINQDNNLLFGYFKDNELIGYIYLKDHLIDGLYVMEEYRHQGVASKLIETILTYADNKNLDYLDINVMAANQDAINLYKKYFFKEFRITLRKNK